MPTKNDIKRKLAELEVERVSLEGEILRREDEYKSYLMKLIEADTSERAFKEELLEWLRPSKSTKPEMTIKEWVLTTIGASAGELTNSDLRSRFSDEFGPARVASLRQYLTKPSGLVQKEDDKLVLTRKGNAALRRLDGN